MLQLMYVSSKCHLFTSLGLHPIHVMRHQYYFCVEHKTEAFLSSMWPGGALKKAFCTCLVFETYKTCTTLISDH